ncbi:VOC family protein [soil metagenome]
MIKVAGLYRLGLHVPDIDATSEFYSSKWMMELDAVEGSRRYFRSRGEDHSDLVLHQGPGKGLDHVGLSVRSEADLAAILDRLESSGVASAIVQRPQPGTRADEQLVAAVTDRDGNRIELIVPKQGGDAAATSAQRRSRHLGHVVLWTPRIAEQEAFFALLGFQVSDRTHIGMSFLRCNTDHHSIALARSGSGKTGLQHAAFDIGTTDDVMREFGRLRQQGESCIWGVGRHGPGNNVFAYYQDPAGNVVEYYGDMETVDDPEVRETRVWGPEHKGDIWGVAGAPPNPFRD